MRPLQELLAERKKYVPLLHRNYTRDDGDPTQYQLILISFDPDEVCTAVVSYCGISALHYSMPMTAFLEQFKPWTGDQTKGK